MFNTLSNYLLKFLFTLPLLYSVEEYPLTTQLNIQEILFKESYIYFIEDKSIQVFNPVKRHFLLPLNKPINSTISFKEDSILICEWENFEINSPEEFSTRILIYERRKEECIKELEFHQTVKPINCSLNILLLETSLPQLEKKYFEYNFEKESLVEINNDERLKVISSWSNYLQSITVYRDMSNLLWVYRKILRF